LLIELDGLDLLAFLRAKIISLPIYACGLPDGRREADGRAALRYHIGIPVHVNNATTCAGSEQER
jgi:hypothetical protein